MHALIVGGTGMLADVSTWFVRTGWNTTVIARNQARLNRLRPDSNADVVYTPLPLDYRNEEQLRDELRRLMNRIGPVDLVVAWIHSIAPRALPAVVEEISAFQRGKWRLFHVKGSSESIQTIHSTLPVPDACLYRQVKLGFVREGDHSRWLTRHEISSGVIQAVQRDRTETVVGTLEPWELRP
jgi:NAD(P)-dependent dehydrogenase (short-subunit alcohol dehydrogenase family)